MTRKYIYGPGIDNPVAMINVSGGNDDKGRSFCPSCAALAKKEASAGHPERAAFRPESRDLFPRPTFHSKTRLRRTFSILPNRDKVYGQPYVMTDEGTDGNWLTEDVSTYASSFIMIGNPIMFTGRWWDSTTQLYYYRFRDYSPQLGRFCQTDPAGYIDTMNLYAYCANNPLNWIDPWGLDKGGGGGPNWTWSWGDMGEFVATGAAGGAVAGAKLAGGPGAGTGALVGAIVGAAGYTTQQVYRGIRNDLTNGYEPIGELGWTCPSDGIFIGIDTGFPEYEEIVDK